LTPLHLGLVDPSITSKIPRLNENNDLRKFLVAMETWHASCN